MTTLVFHHGALGDSVLTWPVLRSLAALGPVTFIAPRDRARLAAKWLGVEPVDGDAPDFARLHAPHASAEVSDELRVRLAEAARIVSFISVGDDAWAANVHRMAGDGKLICLPTRAAGHITDGYVEALGERSVALPVVPVELRRNPDGPIVIHPGSGGAAKCWPAKHYEALIDHLQALGRPVVALLGEAEAERWPGERLERWQRTVDLRWPADLVELSEHLARAAAVVGNDSGPTHLAAQLGVPTVAIFGPTDPRRWAPRGPAVRIFAPPQAGRIESPDNRTVDWPDPEQVAVALAGW